MDPVQVLVKAEGGVEKDKRGKHVKRTFAEEVIDGIVQHVCLFKTVESHYVRKNSNYQYLSTTLDIATMHRLYVKWCAEKNCTSASYFTCRIIVKEKFNIKFHVPKKDRCDLCENAMGKCK